MRNRAFPRLQTQGVRQKCERFSLFFRTRAPSAEHGEQVDDIHDAVAIRITGTPRRTRRGAIPPCAEHCEQVLHVNDTVAGRWGDVRRAIDDASYLDVIEIPAVQREVAVGRANCPTNKHLRLTVGKGGEIDDLLAPRSFVDHHNPPDRVYEV